MSHQGGEADLPPWTTSATERTQSMISTNSASVVTESSDEVFQGLMLIMREV